MPPLGSHLDVLSLLMAVIAPLHMTNIVPQQQLDFTFTFASTHFGQHLTGKSTHCQRCPTQYFSRRPSCPSSGCLGFSFHLAVNRSRVLERTWIHRHDN